MQPISRPSFSTSTPVPPSHSLVAIWNTNDEWSTSLPEAKPPASPTPTTPITMTKEEKTAEMARRKEERKQVWAQH
jgi:SCY1-like protein 1